MPTSSHAPRAGTAPAQRHAESPAEATEPSAPFLRACGGLPVEYTPVWLMQQANHTPHSVAEIVASPELAAELTLQPAERFGVDAVALCSEVSLPLGGMGMQLDLNAAAGVRVVEPLRSTYAIDLLATPTAEEHLSPTLDATRLAAAELAGRDLPLAGWAGAPFTLACYAIEGGGQAGDCRNFARVKALLYSEPAAWKCFMTKLITVLADFLVKQAQAGASALLVSDPWAGLALGRDDYLRFVQPYNRTLFTAIRRSGVPAIHFSAGTSGYLADVAEAGADVLSVDWHMPLDWCWAKMDSARPIHGNLDPVALTAPWRELKMQADRVLAQAQGRPGHIFSLGGELLPQTPDDVIRRLTEYVHDAESDRSRVRA